MEQEVLQEWQTTHFKLIQIMNNEIINLHDLVEIDTKNISQTVMLRFLRLAFMSNSRKFISAQLTLNLNKIMVSNKKISSAKSKTFTT